MRIEFLEEQGYRGGLSVNSFLITMQSDISQLTHKKVVLLGSGVDSLAAEKALLERGIEVYAFADNSDTIVGRTLRGKKILSPNDLFGEDVFFIITVSESNIFGVRLQLMAHGIRDYGIYFNHISSTFYEDNKDIFNSFINGVNFICFHDENEKDALPHIEYASGSSDRNLGNVNWLLTSSTWVRPAWLWIYDILKTKDKSKVLEIGPGFGLCSYVFLDLFSQIEIDWINFGNTSKTVFDEKNKYEHSLSKIYKKYNDRINYKFCMIEMEDDSISDNYDLIIMTEVFEHFAINPVETMIKLRNSLKPKGRIVLTTPNWKHLNTFKSWRELPSSRECGMDRYMDLLQCGHVYQYNRSELDEIFGEAGLLIERYDLSDSGSHNVVLKTEG